MKELNIKKILATNNMKYHSAINGSINAIACTLPNYNNAYLTDAGKLFDCLCNFAICFDFFYF